MSLRERLTVVRRRFWLTLPGGVVLLGMACVVNAHGVLTESPAWFLAGYPMAVVAGLALGCAGDDLGQAERQGRCGARFVGPHDGPEPPAERGDEWLDLRSGHTLIRARLGWRSAVSMDPDPCGYCTGVEIEP